MMRTLARLVLPFLLAVAATALLASAVQTQINLSRLAALGAPVTAGIRVSTTLQDMALFGPVMAAITAAAFLPAFAAAALVSRLLPSVRLTVHALAGATGLWAAFMLMGFVTPMPTFVAAVREPFGLLAMSATGLLGGALFVAAARRTTRPGVQPGRGAQGAA